MGFPNIPTIIPQIDIPRRQVINLLLVSIALEELSLAHILNAEAEKIQSVLGTLSPGNNIPITATLTIDDLIRIDRAVEKTIQTVIKKEMLLQFKFENILELIETDFIDDLDKDFDF